MHAHVHLPPGHLWKTGLLALGLTLALLALGALAAPAVLDLSAPTVTTAETATSGEPAPPPVWKTDPLAPPPLLNAR
jgi:hypothetical protein